MECPFSVEMDDNESDEDPEIDEDEHLMNEEKKDDIKPVEEFKDFKVEKQMLPISKFDEEANKKKEEAELIRKI